jgi:hypothetical protein
VSSAAAGVEQEKPMELIVSEHTKRWPGGCVVWRFHPAMSEVEKETMRLWGSRTRSGV